MTKSNMINIHVDALAFAAGVTAPAHMAVSHAPYFKPAPKHRIRKWLKRLLLALAAALNRAASAVDTPDWRAAPMRDCNI